MGTVIQHDARLRFDGSRNVQLGSSAEQKVGKRNWNGVFVFPDELDLVTRFGLDDISDEADEEEDVEDMIERYSARSRSRLSFSNHESYDAWW